MCMWMPCQSLFFLFFFCMTPTIKLPSKIILYVWYLLSYENRLGCAGTCQAFFRQWQWQKSLKMHFLQPNIIYSLPCCCSWHSSKMDFPSYQTQSMSWKRSEGNTRHAQLSTSSPRSHSKPKLHFLEFWPSAEGNQLDLEKCQFQRFEYVIKHDYPTVI